MTASEVHLKLTTTSPLALDPMLAILEAHAVPGLEVVDRTQGHYRRVLSRSDGTGALVHGVLDVAFSPNQVQVTASPTFAASWLEPRLRRWLDLDADVPVIESALRSSSRLAVLVERTPGVRLLGTLNEFETAMMTVIGQQVSLGAARTFGGRLVAGLGEQYSDLTAFPSPATVAATNADDLQSLVGVTRSRARTLVAVAEAFADGLDLAGRASFDDARAALLAIKGIGPWTADYLALRVLGDRDAFPAHDLVVRKALGVETPAEALALAEPWRPYRAYALFHLWNDYVFL